MTTSGAFRRRPWLQQAAGCALIAAAVVAIYWPALHGGFIWDDDTFLTRNALIHAPDGLRRLWFSREATDYWPVTSTTLWIEWRLWGLHAAGYHATNVALHVIEAILLWAVLRRLGLPGAFLAALLFAVHPVNVESVAWITQRKNLMAMLFYLASLACFLRSERSAWPYWASVACFALAMLSKGSVALLPIVLLGTVAWTRRVTLRDLARMAPFVAIAIAFTWIDVSQANAGAHAAVRDAGLLDRVLGAAAAVLFYLWKALVPTNLIFVYPQWTVDAADWRWWLPLIECLAVTAFLAERARIAAAGRWWRGALFAWGYFCVSLAPVMGFAEVYFMRYSHVSDHYQHLALIGVVAFAAAAWSAWRWRGRAWPSPLRQLPLAAAGLAVAALAVLAYRQCVVYSDIETLYRTTIRRNPGAWLAENNLGELWVGDPAHRAQAIALFRAAAALDPTSPEPRDNLGDALTRAGRPGEAIAILTETIRLHPDDPGAHNNLGNALLKNGESRAAEQQYRTAIRLDPRLATAHYNLGRLLAAEGSMPEAIAELQLAARFDPESAPTHDSLGHALFRAGRLPEAIDEFARAVALDPDSAEARDNLGAALWRSGRQAEAIATWKESLRIHPDDSTARADLAHATR